MGICAAATYLRCQFEESSRFRLCIALKELQQKYEQPPLVAMKQKVYARIVNHILLAQLKARLKYFIICSRFHCEAEMEGWQAMSVY